MNAWTPIAACSAVAFAVALASACTPAAAPAHPCDNQPNMASAVVSLQNARGWLEHAEHDKGGWRVAAIEATDNALQETIRGCQFANTH
jgi:hypothetical protein